MGEKIAIITLAFVAAIGIFYIVLALVELARQRRELKIQEEKTWYKFLEYIETAARLAEERKKNDQDGSRTGKEELNESRANYRSSCGQSCKEND